MRGARRHLQRQEALRETGAWVTLPASEEGWYRGGAWRGAEGCLPIGPLPIGLLPVGPLWRGGNRMASRRPKMVPGSALFDPLRLRKA